MDEVWAGDSLLAFNGRVLEVFGFRGSESMRFHVRNVELSVDEPDRKRRRSVLIKPASKGSGGCMFEVEEEDWASVGPFLDRVLAAIPDED
jgi:hypothetical protein